MLFGVSGELLNEVVLLKSLIVLWRYRRHMRKVIRASFYVSDYIFVGSAFASLSGLSGLNGPHVQCVKVLFFRAGFLGSLDEI